MFLEAVQHGGIKTDEDERTEARKGRKNTVTFAGSCTATEFRCFLPYRIARVESIEKRACTWRKVYALRMDAKTEFCPGDTVGLLAPNSKCLVDELFGLCALEDAPIKVEREGTCGFFYKGMLRDFLTNYFDFKALPKKAFLLEMCRTSAEAEKLRYVCSPEGRNAYFRMYRSGWNINDIIRVFSCKPGARVLLENCELIKPRFFSITGRREENIRLLVGVVGSGHISGFVETCRAGERILWYPRENRLMRMTGAAKLLCICGGTGIAPFLSFARNKAPEQKMWLVFGCRSRVDDLSLEISPGPDVVVSSAFSAEGRRVEDILRENLSSVRSFLEGGSVFLCGSDGLRSGVMRFLGANFSSELCARVLADEWR